MKRIFLLSCLFLSLGSWATQALVNSPVEHHHAKRHFRLQSRLHESQVVTVPSTSQHHGHLDAPDSGPVHSPIKKANPVRKTHRAPLHTHAHD